MAEQEHRGFWWMPRTPHIRVPGRLVIEDDGRSRLEAIGSLDLRCVSGGDNRRSQGSLGPRDELAPEIHGESRGKRITLLNCFTIASDGISPGTRSFQDIHVHEALVCAHTLRNEAVFKEAIVQIENLTSWLAFPDIQDRKEGQGAEFASSKTPLELSCEVDGWKITAGGLAQPFQFTAMRSRHVLEGEVSTYLRFTPPGPVELSAFHNMVHEFTDLITLASGHASGQITLTLIHCEPLTLREQHGKTVEVPTRVESFAARIHQSRPDLDAQADWRFLFSCRDRPFQDLVPDWLRIRRKAQEACNVYFGLQYSRPTYTEVRLLLLSITVEALHKGLVDSSALSDDVIEQSRLATEDGTGQGAKSFRQRIRSIPTFSERAEALASAIDAHALLEVTPVLAKWAKRLKDARNNLAHTGNEASDDDIFYLEGVTSSLISLFFMSKLGLSPEVQRRAAKEVLAPPTY